MQRGRSGTVRLCLAVILQAVPDEVGVEALVAERLFPVKELLEHL